MKQRHGFCRHPAKITWEMLLTPFSESAHHFTEFDVGLPGFLLGRAAGMPRSLMWMIFEQIERGNTTSTAY